MKARVKTPTEFRDNKLRFLNPLATKTISIRTLGFTDDYDLTIPLLTADDTLLAISHPAQIYGKTISIDDNPIIATDISSGDILKSNGTRFLKMDIGLPGQILTVSEDGLDLEWADPTEVEGGGGIPDDLSVTTAKIADDAVTNAKLAGSIAGSKILDDAITTSKIIDGAITNSKLAGSITGSKLTNGTITNTQIATETVTDANLAGSITGSKLLNGTITGTKLSDGIITLLKLNSNVLRAFNPRLINKTPFGFGGGTSTSGYGLFNGSLTSVGTYSHDVLTSGASAKWTTGAVSGNQSGFRTNINLAELNHDFTLRGRFKLSGTTSIKGFIGFVNDNSAFRAGTDSLNAKSGIGLSWDTSVDSNFKIAHNDGTGATVRDDLSTTTALNTSYHTFEIIADDANTRFQFLFDVLTASNISTDIPADNTDLAFQCFVETATTSAVSMWTPYIEGETKTDGN
jgi:hypothetical protein